MIFPSSVVNFFYCSTFVLICLFLSFLLGHGGTDGLHAYVHSLDDAVADMVCFEVHLRGADENSVKIININIWLSVVSLNFDKGVWWDGWGYELNIIAQ